MVQLLLNNPAIMLARIKARTAEAAMATATAIRKSNSSTIMMFFSMPQDFLGLASAAPLTGRQR